MSAPSPAARPTAPELLAVTAVCLLVALPGWRQSAEFSVHMAFDSVALAPPGSLFDRFYLAGGMDVDSFRPAGVLLVRALSALGTPLDPGLGLFKALWLLPFGLVGLWWARRRGLGRLSALVVALCVISPPALFNSWHLSEFDLLGATLLLALDGCLLGSGEAGARTWVEVALAAVAALAAILLKDSLAVLALVFLGLAGLASWRRRGDAAGSAPLLATGCAAALGVWMLTQMPDFVAHAGDAAAGLLRGPLVTGSQALALVGLPGVLAIGLLAFGRRLPGAAVLGVSVAHLLVPRPFRVQFFGCYVFDSVLWVGLLTGLLLVSTLWLARRGEAEQRPLALLVAVGLIAFSLLPALLRMRADVSTRVLLPLAPALFGLTLLALVGLARGPGLRLRRIGALVLATSLVWGGVTSGWEFGALMLTSDAVELEVKRGLVERVHGPTVLLPRNRIQETTLPELEALRGGELPVRFVRLTWPVHRGGDPLLEQTGMRLADLGAGGHRVYTSSLDVGSLAWWPDARTGRGGGEGLWPFPRHWIDDARLQRRTRPLGAVDRFGEATVLVDARRIVPVVPTALEELVWRLLRGLPVLERLEVRAELAELEVSS